MFGKSRFKHASLGPRRAHAVGIEFGQTLILARLDHPRQVCNSLDIFASLYFRPQYIHFLCLCVWAVYFSVPPFLMRQTYVDLVLEMHGWLRQARLQLFTEVSQH